MNKNYSIWTVSLSGVLLLGVGVSSFAQLDKAPPLEKDDTLNATNRLSLSLRFGLNINAKFHGIGSAGSPGHYSDGYVLTDSTGNFLGYTSFWGYDNASQYNQVPNTVTYHNPVPANAAAPASGNGDSNPGVELTYDRQLGVKEDWHDLRYGLEFALNYLKFSLNSNSSGRAAVTTESYLFGGIPGQVPLPGYRGGFSGNPGDPVLVAGGTPGADTAGALLSHDDFDADIWGGRLGPYIELPFGKKEQFTILLTGGLAVGLVHANESWKQTLVLDGTGSASTTAGGGSDTGLLWGWYAGATANYKFNEHWGVSAGVQFQDLGIYNHNFGGRTAQLDLSQSVFLEVGVSYSF
jgi:hypothetical protein